MPRYTGLALQGDSLATEYEYIGPFRLPVYNDLVPGEARAIDAYRSKSGDTGNASVQAAKAIAKQRNCSVKEAMDFIQSLDVEKDPDTLYEYFDHISSISKSTNESERDLEYATALLRYRGEAKDENDKWIKLPEWDREETEFHIKSQALLSELSSFLQKEQNAALEKQKKQRETKKASKAKSLPVTTPQP